MKKILILILACPVAAFAMRSGELAIVGYESGSLRLALVATSPLVKGESFFVVPADGAGAAALVRLNRNVAAGEVVQIAGSFCSAGDISLHGDPLAFRRGNGLSLRFASDPSVEFAATPGFFGESGATYVGPRRLGSPDELDLLLAERTNWREGPMPAQENFLFRSGRFVPRISIPQSQATK